MDNILIDKPIIKVFCALIYHDVARFLSDYPYAQYPLVQNPRPKWSGMRI